MPPDHVRRYELGSLGQHATERVKVASVDDPGQFDGDGIAMGQRQPG
jgi:hypothetical protein